MILIIDDHRPFAESLADALVTHSYSVKATFNTKSALEALKNYSQSLECIILDVMMPPGQAFSPEATGHGKFTGMQMFASIRSVLPEIPIFIITHLRDRHIIEWFEKQVRTQVWLKSFEAERFLTEIDKVLKTLGPRLIQRLKKCKPGREDFKQFENICVDILKYLFVPPLPDVFAQVATRDRHEIRDAIMVNYGAPGFWAEIRDEFSSKNIPSEFKNYAEPIGIKEVQQLRIRLDKPGLGRFGLLISRRPPSKAAKIEQRNSYASNPQKLILFLDDTVMIEMINKKHEGGDPSNILQYLKTDFELKA